MCTPSSHDGDIAACPLPDGSLCGTCPDCQADAINDAQWPDGGISVVIPEQPAAQGQCDHRYVPIGRNWRGRTIYACRDCGDRYAAKTVEELKSRV